MKSGKSMHIDSNGRLPLAVDDFIGESVAVLGKSGSGKSNTVAVIVEELLAQGVPVCVVDIAGEYYGLKEKFKLFSIGNSIYPEHMDSQDMSLESVPKAAVRSYQNAVSVILDVSGYRKTAREEFLLGYLEALWQVSLKSRHPYVLVVEEAHNYIPQRGTTPLTDIFATMAVEGRKRGISCIIATQRVAKVDKDVLSQCGISFLHKVSQAADLKTYYDVIPRTRAQVRDVIGKQKPGDAYVLFGESAQSHRIRVRTTPHGGRTPTMDDLPENRGVNSIDDLVGYQMEMPGMKVVGTVSMYGGSS